MKTIVEKLNACTAQLIVGKGSTPDQISHAEAELDVKFANDYKACLLAYGVFGFDGHEITGISEDKRWNVVEITKNQRALNPSIPGDFYVIELANIDGIVVWQNASGKIYGTAMNGEPSLIANNLSEFLQV